MSTNDKSSRTFGSSVNLQLNPKLSIQFIHLRLLFSTRISLSIISLSTPNKDKLSAAINPQEDLTKVAFSKGDPVKMWQEIVKRYNGMGLQQAIREVNEQLLHPN
ncbi:hypothetical protein ACFPYJ_29955 [Paenibacillus solisilvae]|uniref:Uncharacterized protein n=1 Tax=Paenibacillus solisilvae TaxID=2486751 RepID=A0ABW0W4Y9_9BACL